MSRDAQPTLADVEAAAERIRPYGHRTPVLTSSFFLPRAESKSR